jgi:hypothetical protein
MGGYRGFCPRQLFTSQLPRQALNLKSSLSKSEMLPITPQGNSLFLPLAVERDWMPEQGLNLHFSVQSAATCH